MPTASGHTKKRTLNELAGPKTITPIPETVPVPPCRLSERKRALTSIAALRAGILKSEVSLAREGEAQRNNRSKGGLLPPP